MTLRLLIAAVVAVAIAIGFTLPAPHQTHGADKAQIPMQEIGQG